ncbi:MAG TPA: hypothetical protein PL053_10550, partial [Deltaproteobacteria bacterium]|nr:hypothetical protein [Deltaproteobacteria bacterium]
PGGIGQFKADMAAAVGGAGQGGCNLELFTRFWLKPANEVGKVMVKRAQLNGGRHLKVPRPFLPAVTRG